jgi:outer membrane lipoprotein-sorting protein
MKKILFLLLIYAQPLQSLEFVCKFEEVYPNGEVQQGNVFFKKDKLRYEYYNPELYVLLYVNNKLFMINNINRNQIQFIENHNNVIPGILEIYEDYPNFKDKYSKNNSEITLEQGAKFFKRISIKSHQLNLSIFFIGCQEVLLDEQYFNFNPFKEYVPN